MCVLDEVMILEKCLQSMNYDTDLIIPLSCPVAAALCSHWQKWTKGNGIDIWKLLHPWILPLVIGPILWLRNCSQFSFIIKQHDVSFFKINKAYLYNTTKSNLHSPPSRILCLPSWKVVVYCNICTSTQLYQIHTNNVGRYILDILYSYHYMSERKLNQVRRLIEIVDPGIWSPCIFK